MAGQTAILEGIRVLEFGWAVAGPLTTSWAGGYGAEVIKVETRTRPDIIRSFTPFKNDKADLNNSHFFARENANKKSITLNLKHPQGREVALNLAAQCDVVLESYTSGAMAKLGLAYEDLVKVKPDLIMISSCMYGQSGDLRSMPGYGMPLTALCGLTHLCGWPDRAPCGPYGAYTDYLVPRFNLLAIAAALDYRRRTGQGVYMDAAQLEAGAQFVAPALLERELTGKSPSRIGNRDPQAAPHGVYPCAGEDRWVAITVFTDEQWQAMAQAMGSPDWSLDPELASAQGRLARCEELDRRLADWTGPQQARAVMELLQGVKVPAGVANDGRDLGQDPQIVFDGHYARREHPVMGQVDYAGHSLTFSAAPQKVERSPCLGEHTKEICLGLLGMDQAEYDALERDGAFE
ncbi:MAG: CoA transferase [Deltaproteobacteria bacterium]|nr:CoA transferase [Deltaproteobacteria bacterium]